MLWDERFLIKCSCFIYPFVIWWYDFGQSQAKENIYKYPTENTVVINKQIDGS